MYECTRARRGFGSLMSFFAENLKDNNVGLAALIASNYVHLIEVTECWKLHLSSKNFRVERRKIWFVMPFVLETSIR